MGLLEKVADTHRGRTSGGRKSWSEPSFWDLDHLRWPFLGSSSLNPGRESIEHDFEGYVRGVYKRNGPVFALMLVRMAIFSEARFQFRQLRNGRPGELFGSKALAPLEQPWPGGTMGDLLARMIQDVDLAGNSFVAMLNGRLRRLRPDWVTIVSASRNEPDLYGAALDAEVIGYFYCPPGSAKETLLLPNQVAHFAPIPDPEAHWRGMSWLTPVLREVSSDLAATRHKSKFFENGATPQVIVTFDKTVKPETIQKLVATMEYNHEGVDNAYRTLYLGGGADVTIAGKDLGQIDFKATQGAGETRLATAAGVPAAIVGFTEGLGGSSLNAGNYGQARRRFADGTLRPLWRNAAGSLASIIDVPQGAELWYDDRDIAFLREDRKDAAEIQRIKTASIASLISAGYTAGSIIDAIEAEDFTLLEHSGLYSVQLQPPGATQTLPPGVTPPSPTTSAPPDDSSGSDPAEE